MGALGHNEDGPGMQRRHEMPTHAFSVKGLDGQGQIRRLQAKAELT